MEETGAGPDRGGEPAHLAVEIDHVSKRYGRKLALDRISLTVRSGEFFALLGPNGAGKTTLMHILCTILRPDEGRARVGGKDVLTDPRGARRHIGVVFQQPSLDDRLSVEENLEFHGLVYGVAAPLRKARIKELLAIVELDPVRKSIVRTLSSGMKRRLEIARALLHDARILLLDEPTVGLDVQSRQAIWGYLRRLRDDRKLTVVVTTHYIDEVETCDRVSIVDAGRVLAEGTPSELKAAHGRQLLRIVPSGEAAASELLQVLEGDISRRGSEILVHTPAGSLLETVLARCGDRIRRMTVEEPSLESVFLALTGRDLRDEPASPRDRTFEFGKRGGELTR